MTGRGALEKELLVAYPKVLGGRGWKQTQKVEKGKIAFSEEMCTSL